MSVVLEVVQVCSVVDTPCDKCGRVINEGEDCAYDQGTDEVFCAECADKELNFLIE